jgi:hypothetical protein
MAAGLLAVACGGGTTPTTAPATTSINPTPAPTTATETTAPATQQPTAEATAEPTAEATTGPSESLDPSQSDASVVGRVTISNDTRGGRDGTWDIVGVKDDGFISGCSYSFDGDEFTAVAFYDDAPDGQIRHMAVTVTSDNVPDADYTVTDIQDGRVYIDFMSESGFGTAYVADTDDDDRTSVTVSVTKSGDLLTFDYDGLTWDQIPFVGQMVCGEIS